MADFIRTTPLDARLHEPLRRTLAGVDAAWPALSDADVAALVEHGVAPLVYAKARVPELREQALTAAAVEPLRLADLRRVLRAFAERNIDARVVKGTALAYSLYDEPELRPRADTDLLVARPSFPDARTALLDLGHTARVQSGDELGMRQETFTRVDAHGVEHVYDLHWAIANSPLFADALCFDELACVPLPRISSDAFTIARAEALLLACVHRVAHHHDSDRLMWLIDVGLLRAAMSAEEHRAFWRLARDRRVIAVCMRAIELAEFWNAAAELPLSRAGDYLTERDLAQDEPSRAFLDRDMTYGAVMLADLRGLPWRTRMMRLRQLAFPPRAFMRESFPSRGRLALPWLYLYRGLRGVARLFARVGAR